MSKDYYSILGVSKSASGDEIKTAFRKKAHEHHPDKGGDESKFKEVNEAYQVLSNADKRRQYDQFGSDFQNGQAGGAYGGFSGFNGANINMEDLSDLFGGFGDMFGFGGPGGGRRRGPERGRDLEMSLSIEFLESIHGLETEIKFPHLKTCKTCHGSGHAPDAKIETCNTCRGTGRVSRLQRTILGSVQTQAMCPDCQGEGKKASASCKECHGQGRTKQDEKLKVKIPAGINHGESIRLSGYGDAGEKGASAGDLYLKVRVSPHPDMKREGDDIYSQAEISMSQAALGTTIEVTTAYGQVKLKIPSGTQPQTVFRLKEKGAPRIHGRGQGDHFVKVKVVIPKSLNKKQREALESLGL
ncbi:molecular chaperone DnaJ [Candidatus Falkowbacteria bacterium HGW-Falkowbacteria-2]|uniref:Chaperone protein DnaJ n=1 Tax=Candidatus Falkowbacteria bacterium HGW-Falkowbacteria-2 TaxID=2013769 RepID=A0A2N2E396_9BACT|nr:MAG: molecular chaperone DnaJ [Candidatus Falkowbacteria bacterium HGW-Falkowbacteria-2]